MKCRHARLAIERRSDGELQLERGFELDQHLENCHACRALWERAQELEDGLLRLAEPPLHALNVEAAIERLRERRAPQVAEESASKAPWRLTPQLTLALAAAALLIVVLVWQLPGRREQPLPHANDSTEVASSHGALVPDNDAEGIAADSPAIDNDLLERARAEVRAQLLAGSVPSGAGAAEGFALAFDEGVRPLKQLDWPVLRIVERLLEDPDQEVGCAAARYLGLRGDRNSRRQLAKVFEQSAFEREGFGEQITRAFADAGGEGLAGLALALQEPSQRELACQFLIAMQSPLAAQAVAEVLASEQALSEEEGESQDLVETLVAMGPIALPTLLGLGDREELGIEPLCEVLRAIPTSAAWLAEALQESGLTRVQQSTRLRCAARLAPEAAADWILEHIHERPWREFVCEQLPDVRGVAAVNALVELSSDARLGTRDLDQLVADCLQRDPLRFATAIEERRQEPSLDWFAALGERLVAAQTALAMPAFRALSLSPQVDDALRRELVISMGLYGTLEDVARLAQLFDSCTEDQRQLAAACLIALTRLGGEDALRVCLQGQNERTQSNLLFLLRRREAGTRATPSIYKLARELRPLLRARAPDTRNSSS